MGSTDDNNFASPGVHHYCSQQAKLSHQVRSQLSFLKDAFKHYYLLDHLLVLSQLLIDKLFWSSLLAISAGDYRYLFTQHFCVLNFTLFPDVEEIFKLAHMKVIELPGKSTVELVWSSVQNHYSLNLQLCCSDESKPFPDDGVSLGNLTLNSIYVYRARDVAAKVDGFVPLQRGCDVVFLVSDIGLWSFLCCF